MVTFQDRVVKAYFVTFLMIALTAGILWLLPTGVYEGYGRYGYSQFHYTTSLQIGLTAFLGLVAAILYPRTGQLIGWFRSNSHILRVYKRTGFALGTFIGLGLPAGLARQVDLASIVLYQTPGTVVTAAHVSAIGLILGPLLGLFLGRFVIEQFMTEEEISRGETSGMRGV